MKRTGLLLLFSLSSVWGLSMLHLTFHNGCANEVAEIARRLGLELTTWNVLGSGEPIDGITYGNERYNVTHDFAERAFCKYRDYFSQFDVILTSDTTPLSRIFLQNGWEKPLVIWVSNRFDYGLMPGADREEYFELLRKARHMPNVQIILTTPFEGRYARSKGVDLGDEVIHPAGFAAETQRVECKKSGKVYLPNYSNENALAPFVIPFLESRGIRVDHMRYGTYHDLQEYSVVVHFPYSWMTFALYEYLQLNVTYLIPSKVFFLKLSRNSFYWFQDKVMIRKNNLDEIDWYNPALKDKIVYFNSWEDLVMKIRQASGSLSQGSSGHYEIPSNQSNAALQKWAR